MRRGVSGPSDTSRFYRVWPSSEDEAEVGVSRSVLGVDSTPHQSFFQIAGAGYRIATPLLIRALEASPSLHDLLLRYIHVLTVQTAATAMSNGDNVLSERLEETAGDCYGVPETEYERLIPKPATEGEGH
jgi:hypothetical protein